ncbi:MAG: reverse transcriptase-like protein [Planctomycetes bacterium]|nr:reverse transcriptase-like protein [Planctomycetota bacterium]
MTLSVYFDGLCQPKNPGGVATYGFLIKRDGKLLHEDCGLAAEPFTEGATNNVAEYTGVLKALEWILAQGLEKEPIVVRGDSELAIRQLRGEYKVKAPSIVNLFVKAREMSFRFPSLRFEWVPREQNREADALTNRAYAQYQAGGSGAPRIEPHIRYEGRYALETEIPAAPADVFQALTRAELMKRWSGRHAAALPPEAGSAEEIVPDRRLSFRTRAGTKIEIALTPSAAGTRLRCEESEIATPTAGTTAAYLSMLSSLRAFFETKRPGAPS